MARLAAESELRRTAEDDARAMLESSPAAILTVDEDGSIDMANDAARKLLGLGETESHDLNIGLYFPILLDILKAKKSLSLVRTMVECSGRKKNGEMFFAQVWVSSYKTPAGTKMAAVVADVSEQLRDREELGLQQLLMNSKIIVGAVSHEIRNLAAAADLLHNNLRKKFDVESSEDFDALGRVIDALRKVAADDVPASVEAALSGVDLNMLLHELQILAGSGDDELELTWEVTEGLPECSRRPRRTSPSPAESASKQPARAQRKPQSASAGNGLPTRVFRCDVPGRQRSRRNPARESLSAVPERGAFRGTRSLHLARHRSNVWRRAQYYRRDRETCFLIELPAMVDRQVAAV